METLYKPTEKGWHAARDLRLTALAIGVAGIVGDVDDRSIGKQRSRRLQH